MDHSQATGADSIVRRRGTVFALLLLLLSSAAPAPVRAEPSDEAVAAAEDELPPPEPAGPAVTGGPDWVVELRGWASWYGRRWRGRRTASGERYDDRALTAAHLWLPFATRARVTNLENGRSVDVVVTDRGPHTGGDRIIDLSARAAEALGMKGDGIAEVLIVVEASNPARSTAFESR
jgi:rare lipoprotein A